MSDMFNKLFETGILGEEVRSDLQEAWDAKIKENKDTVTAELREEFANRYEHDKSNMVEAIDKMISERLESEIAEIAEDKKALAEATVSYKKKVSEHSEKLQEFMLKQLTKEIGEKTVIRFQKTFQNWKTLLSNNLQMKSTSSQRTKKIWQKPRLNL